MAETNRGRLGASELTANTAEAVYTVGANIDANVDVKVVNKGAETAEISIAIVDGGATDLADEDYIVYKAKLAPETALLEDGLTNIDLTAAESIVVNTNRSDVTCVVTGVEQDEASSSDGFPLLRKITSQSLDHAAFTDNEDTTGYIDITTQLPAGAVPLGWKATVSEAFDGDTTATIQVGIDGNLDMFSAVTDQSVAAIGTVGSVVDTDACDGIAAAQTVRVTVTGGADFTTILGDAGTMVVEVYYIATA